MIVSPQLFFTSLATGFVLWQSSMIGMHGKIFRVSSDFFAIAPAGPLLLKSWMMRIFEK
jgi:hypothetical protein